LKLIKNASLYWHTIRHLKLCQIYGRLRFRLSRPNFDLSPPPQIQSRLGTWTAPIRRNSSLIGPDEFVFFKEHGSLAVIGWEGGERSDLWRYNQHYFDDLNSSSASEKYMWHKKLLSKWMEENKSIYGVGWDPYPTSLRIVNWIKWTLAGNELPYGGVHSLAVQARYLSGRIEWHLLGNHLLANAKALVFAGLFFRGKEANKWLELGLKIIQGELSEQILLDGGHFERSTMYHAIILEDLLDLINASKLWSTAIKASIVLEWEDIASKMLSWLSKMIHPDGEISLFNDAGFNIAATPLDLFSYAHSLGLGVENIQADECPLKINVLEESGYIRLSSSNAVAFLDVAPVGPDYLPGHAHADTLSFELSLFNQRIIVNGGTSLYGISPQRLRERHTLAHSTVEVDQMSSSEVWGGFRVARRAKPFDLHITPSEGRIYVGCSHNGYARLKGKPIHHREWNLTANDLMISDRVTGGEHKSTARFIFHPSVSIERLNSSEWCIYTSLGQKVLFRILSGNGFVEPATYAPEFGTVVQTQCLAIDLRLGCSQVKLQWN